MAKRRPGTASAELSSTYQGSPPLAAATVSIEASGYALVPRIDMSGVVQVEDVNVWMPGQEIKAQISCPEVTFLSAQWYNGWTANTVVDWEHGPGDPPAWRSFEKFLPQHAQDFAITFTVTENFPRSELWSVNAITIPGELTGTIQTMTYCGARDPYYWFGAAAQDCFNIYDPGPAAVPTDATLDLAVVFLGSVRVPQMFVKEGDTAS